jgi:hypothetical protein
VAHPVVHLALFLVSEDFLCRLCLLELLLGVRVVTDVRVVLPDLLAVGLVYLLL